MEMTIFDIFQTPHPSHSTNPTFGSPARLFSYEIEPRFFPRLPPTWPRTTQSSEHRISSFLKPSWSALAADGRMKFSNWNETDVSEKTFHFIDALYALARIIMQHRIQYKKTFFVELNPWKPSHTPQKALRKDLKSKIWDLNFGRGARFGAERIFPL